MRNIFLGTAFGVSCVSDTVIEKQENIVQPEVVVKEAVRPNL